MKALVIYIVIWFLVLAFAGIVNSTGFSSAATETVFGLIFVTLFVTGAATGFPFWINERNNSGENNENLTKGGLW